MLPHKKQLLRRNAWYRQQLQTQQNNSNARQHDDAQQKTVTDGANNPAMPTKH
jgi:hypothetical protein